MATLYRYIYTNEERESIILFYIVEGKELYFKAKEICTYLNIKEPCGIVRRYVTKYKRFVDFKIYCPKIRANTYFIDFQNIVSIIFRSKITSCKKNYLVDCLKAIKVKVFSLDVKPLDLSTNQNLPANENESSEILSNQNDSSTEKALDLSVNQSDSLSDTDIIQNENLNQSLQEETFNLLSNYLQNINACENMDCTNSDVVTVDKNILYKLRKENERLLVQINVKEEVIKKLQSQLKKIATIALE